jgi:5-methylcytosine-specific restriction endonuclease McrA
MKKHVKIYYDHYQYSECDSILCQVCGKIAVDIHHIEPKGMGGKAGKDRIDNLIALCRKCHEDAHKSKLNKEDLRAIINA